MIVYAMSKTIIYLREGKVGRREKGGGGGKKFKIYIKHILNPTKHNYFSNYHYYYFFPSRI
jgi:hypothetical protein